LRLPEFALAQACALGREAAWERFLGLYRGPLTQAAIAITGSGTLGHDLADSLYAELFGLGGASSQSEGMARRSPLASYSGRGSLLGWLRSTLAQRHIDHHRRTRRETSLEAVEETQPIAAPLASVAPLPDELDRLAQAVARSLATLAPEDRFLLSAYFLDRQTLLQIARLLRVHEATVSRKLKRLTAELRKQLLRELQAGGLSKRGSEEALGADPRDLEINLRGLLQTSQSPPFLNQTIRTQTAVRKRFPGSE
jgi:RNA polymerase sigma-70 factor (ECF subfamily)